MRLFQLYNHFSRDLAKTQGKEWPISWKRRSYKVYPGAEISVLDHSDARTQFCETDIRKLLHKRRSARDYVRDNYISSADLGSMIYFSCGEYKTPEQKTRRTYPSGGAMYPVEVYIFIKRSNGELKTGIYHYRHDLHALEFINANFDSDNVFTYSWARDAPAAILLTAHFGRNIEKYGERSYRYALLEAGHMSQNFALMGAAMNIRVTSLGGMRDNLINDAIGIDGVTESLIHGLVIG